jgi:hypothetical protein
VIRALITAALLTGAAMHFFNADPYVAFGYSLVLSVTLWFFWPLLRRILRLVSRRGRRTAEDGTVPSAVKGVRLQDLRHTAAEREDDNGRVELFRRRSPVGRTASAGSRHPTDKCVAELR